jgi:hypothetical protein
LRIYLRLPSLIYEKILEELAAIHGCLPPPILQNQRPLGIDRLEQIFRADAEFRLMELFLFHFRQTGYTLQQLFLRNPAFGTVDPANLEAIFSTKFKGKSTYNAGTKEITNRQS